MTTGKWTWINGKTVTIDKWQKDQPQDGNFYALMARESSNGVNGSFSSLKANINRGWICQEQTGIYIGLYPPVPAINPISLLPFPSHTPNHPPSPLFLFSIKLCDKPTNTLLLPVLPRDTAQRHWPHSNALVLSTGRRSESDERLRIETSASESLYGGQFTLSTQLIKPDDLVIHSPTQHYSFFTSGRRPFTSGRRAQGPYYFLQLR